MIFKKLTEKIHSNKMETQNNPLLKNKMIIIQRDPPKLRSKLKYKLNYKPKLKLKLKN